MNAPAVSIKKLWTVFKNGSKDAVIHKDLDLNIERGEVLSLVGCHYGLRVKPNTESLGQGTTASVVTSITVVILVDALFAILFKDVGT